MSNNGAGFRFNIDLLLPEHAIKEKPSEAFQGVEVTRKGFSAWLDNHTYFKLADTFDNNTSKAKDFNECIYIEGEKYQVSSCHFDSTIKSSLASENVAVKIIKINGHILPREAERLSQQVRMLFSLLLGLPLNLESTWLISAQKQQRKHFYFSTEHSANKPFKYSNECLVQSSYIFDNNLWGVILKNYFTSENSSNFQNIWSKIPKLYNHKGHWENELLAYVSILDSYINKTADEHCIQLPQDVFLKLKNNLLTKVSDAQDEASIDCSAVINSIKNKINNIKNTNLTTFDEKYDYLISNIDRDIKGLVNIASSDFLEIKKIRDSNIQGQPAQILDFESTTYEFEIKYKLQILLTYFIYKDLGFTPANYATCLKTTHSEFVQRANINTFHRDMLTGETPTYNVSKQCYIESTKHKRHRAVIEFFKSENIYRYNTSLTESLRTQNPNNQMSLSGYIKFIMPDSEHLVIENIKQAYLLHEEKPLALHNLVLITYN